MPRLPIDIQISPADVTSTTRIDGWGFDDAQDSPLRNLQHRTRLPGGFWELTFNLFMTQAEYTEWRLNRGFSRLKMIEAATKVIWEGRLEAIKKDPTGWGGNFIFRGYWRSFTDNVDEVNRTETGITMMKQIRDAVNTLNASQLSASDTNITAVVAAVNIDRSDLGKSAWKLITEQLATIDDDSGNPVDIAVWEDREVYYTSRNPTSIDWSVFIDAGVLSFAPNFDLADMFNSVDGRYTTTLTTGYSTNAASVTKFAITREREVGSVQLDSAGATAARDLFLAARKDGLQVADSLVVNRIFDSNGVEGSLCRVRAGEVVKIQDFLTRTQDVGSATPNGINTFVIEETTCSHRAGSAELTMRIGGVSNDLGSILRRNGVT